MTEHATPLAEPTTQQRRAWWLVPLAILTCVGVGLLWWVDPRQLPWPMCTFYALTAWYCPGCGATRATHELLHGRLLGAFRENAFWMLLWPLAVYAVASEVRYLNFGRPLPGNLARKPWLFIAIAVAGIVFCVLRNVPSYPFTLLAPLN